MAGAQLELIVAARDEATPVLNGASRSLGGLQGAVKSYGSATLGAQVAASTFYDGLRASRAASDTAAEGLGGVTEAAKHLARGGFADLLSQVPVVGNAFARFTASLGGFPLVAGGMIGAGIGILKMLNDMDDAASKSLSSITALSVGIGTKFQATLLEVQKIRAQAAGDQIRIIEVTEQQEIQSATATAKARIDKAKEELNQLDILGRKRTELSKEALLEIQDAEGDLRNETIKIHERKNAQLADLDKQRVEFTKTALAALAQAESDRFTAEGNPLAAIEAERQARLQSIADEQKAANEKIAIFSQIPGKAAEAAELRRVAEQIALDKTVAAEIDAAEKRKAAIAGSTSAAIDIFSKLGDQFSDITQSLGLAKFLQDSEAELQKLDTALKTTAITQEQYARGTKALKDAMADAARNGAAPLAKGLNDVSSAANTSSTAFDAASREAAGLASSLGADSAALARAAETGGEFVSQVTQIQQSTFLARLKAGEFGQEYADVMQTANDATSALVDRIDEIGGALEKAANGFESLTATATGAIPDTIKGTGPGGLVTIDDLFRSGFLKFSTGVRAFDSGGVVSRPTLATVGESQPEMVVGSPSSQNFARQFAVAIAKSLRDVTGQNVLSTSPRAPQVIQLVVDRKVLAHTVVPAARKESGRGVL